MNSPVETPEAPIVDVEDVKASQGNIEDSKGTYGLIVNIINTYYSKKGNLLPPVIEYLETKNDYIAFYDSASDLDLYIYKDGLYIPHGNNYISEELTSLNKVGIFVKNKVDIRNRLSTNKMNEVAKKIRINHFKNRDEVNPPLELIGVDNGILNINTGERIDYSPKYIFFGKLRVKYNPSATCPKFEKFLYEILPDKDIPTIYELFGYCLYRKYNIQKAFMMIGEGANGKSTLIGVLEAFLGKENCSHVSIQQFAKDRFAPINLYGKMANMYADLEDEDIQNDGMFKQLCGEDGISGDDKYKSRINFANYAKMIFSCNKLPRVKNKSDAFFRRWIMISFPHKFEGKKDNTNLKEELTSEEELSGILNKSLEGLKRLLKNKQFTSAESTETIKEKYLRLSDPIHAFVMDVLFTSANADISKAELYREYVVYCEKEGFAAVSDIMFSKGIREMIRITECKRGTGQNQYEAWSGVRLKTAEEIEKKLSGEKAESERIF